MFGTDLQKYIICSVVAFAATYFLTPLIRSIAPHIGMMDRPGERRIHQKPTPRGGGLAIVVGFHLAFLVFAAFDWHHYALKLHGVWWRGFLMASSIIVITGLVDDIRGVKPWVKLGGQALAAWVIFDHGVHFGAVVAWEMPLLLDFGLTLLWFLVITNAFNLIDGMDGLASGLALISALGLMGALIFRRMSVDAVVVLMLASCCLAFLRYNFHPASIFLGDTGSMFLGFTMATFAMETSSKGTFLLTIGVALMALGIPFFDALLAIWRRSLRMLFPNSLPTEGGKAGIMKADAQHLHHRMLLTMDQKKVAGYLFAANAVLVCVVLLSVIFKPHAVGIYLVAFVAGTYLVVRHLANVELWDTGTAIIDGLHQPRARVVVFILYPLVDLVLLSVMLGASIHLIGMNQSGAKPFEFFLTMWPFWVGPVFIALFIGKVYSRVWSQARFVDYLVLMICLIGGVVLAMGLYFLAFGVLVEKVVLFALVYGSLGHMSLSFIRMFGRGIRDTMSYLSLSSHGSHLQGRLPVLVYGTGPRLTLFLREKSFRKQGPGREKVIVGVLDDDPNLRHRIINGYQVLGGLESLSHHVDEKEVKEIIVLEDLTEQVREELIALSKEVGFRLTEWNYLEEVISEGIAKDQQPQQNDG